MSKTADTKQPQAIQPSKICSASLAFHFRDSTIIESMKVLVIFVGSFGLEYVVKFDDISMKCIVDDTLLS